MLFVIAGIIAITQGQRKIPVQYAKKIVGRRVYGGANTHIPLKVNTAGVIPIIFAQAIIMFPATLGQMFPDAGFLTAVSAAFRPPQPLYVIVYSALIILFTYFYTAVILNPVDLADNMKKNSGFIPGVRPGKKTAEYIDRVLTRVTLPGAVFLAIIAILPDMMITAAEGSVLLRRHGTADRGRRRPGHAAADRVASRHAPLRRLHDEGPVAREEVAA